MKAAGIRQRCSRARAAGWQGPSDRFPLSWCRDARASANCYIPRRSSGRWLSRAGSGRIDHPSDRRRTRAVLVPWRENSSSATWIRSRPAQSSGRPGRKIADYDNSGRGVRSFQRDVSSISRCLGPTQRRDPVSSSIGGQPPAADRSLQGPLRHLVYFPAQN